MTRKLTGVKVYLRKSDFKTWINTRDERYSNEAFEYDPGMPHRSVEEELSFY